jgi:branched-subunit amino acid ABC-type transport system permease component
MLLFSAIVTGLGLGAMYGLLALGYHVTYAVSGTVNFAQGSTMMLGAVVCFSLWVTFGLPLGIAIPVALLATAAWSVVVERVAVRPFVSRGSNAWLMATVALGIAAGAHRHAVERAQSRRQFGRPIGEFQGLAWMVADMGIAVEAVEQGERAERLVLVSGDGDFAPLIRHLRRRGLVVEVASFSEGLSSELVQVADRVIPLDRGSLE